MGSKTQDHDTLCGLMDMSKDPNADTKLSYKRIDQKPTSRNKLQQV